MLKQVLEYILNEYAGIIDDDYVDWLLKEYDIGNCTIMELMQLAHDYEMWIRGM